MSIAKRISAFFSGTSTPSSTGSTPPGGTAAGSSYAPEIDGEPDPGEVVWAWVPYEDDPSQGKDRPVLVLDTAGDGPDDGWVGLMLSSQDHDRDAEDEARWGRYWMDVGTGGWDSQGRPSEVRLDRLVRLERGAVRREGAALDETIFTSVVEARRGLSR
ncbi:type II toxin-antitoxin system PemK/MazF family toxin [uncultured Nocardioides sp.]|uniref:type II toxin-antitoxin system PemK/MazF family toxin n=1 Tax=uncultured Nocardioides sp. TaxID=198441 RepID=UPI002626BB51|nr:type II toxin-antitoxin system PemK/MazF family toxin [uncultured Nocardioides sp.]